MTIGDKMTKEVDRKRITRKPKQSSAYYICATVDVFNIQVVLLVGDFDECCKLVDENRAQGYICPKISDGLRLAKEETDKDRDTRNGYNAFTTHVEPFVIIYAPKQITLSTLVHEISHAVDYIFHITCCDDGELRAYLCGYLFTELSAKGDSVITAQGETT